MVVYKIPLNEIVFDFYDRLKSITSGYASFDYEIVGHQESDLVKVQILITTHDYFLQQYLNMYMAFPESNTDQIDIRFFSLFFEDGAIKAEMADTISELQHNSIMEEFDAIYNREQGFIYDRIRE